MQLHIELYMAFVIFPLHQFYKNNKPGEAVLYSDLTQMMGIFALCCCLKCLLSVEKSL